MAEVDPDDPAQVAAVVRAEHGDELTTSEKYETWVLDRVLPWSGRAIEPGTVDQIVAAEWARATKSLRAVRHLVLGGFGPQAAMVNRSMFEGFVLAYWAHLHPLQAWNLIKQHARQDELLTNDGFVASGWASAEDDDIDLGTDAERAALAERFGKYGHKPWTGHGNLREVLLAIEHLWNEDEREHLWSHWRVVHRRNNQVLHSSSTSLALGVRLDQRGAGFDVGPSSTMLQMALLPALYCYAQITKLLWVRFGLPDRAELDRLEDALVSALPDDGGEVEMEGDGE